MAAIVRFFKSIATNPMETIEFVVPVVLLLSGIWAGFYAPHADSLAKRLSSGDIIMAYTMGFAHLAIALPLLYSILHKTWAKGIKVRRWISFICFLLFMFYGIAGVIVHGLDRISWLSSFAFAVISAVSHIRLRWDENA